MISPAKILLCIPTFNCERQVARVIAQLDAWPAERWFEKTLFIDNASTDNTANVIQKSLSTGRRQLICNQGNVGLGGSHKVAFQYALDHAYDAVVVFHGDDQANLEDIRPCIETGDWRDYDCLLGARFMRGSRRQGYSMVRTFGNYALNALYSLVLRRPVYDLGSGLNLYKVDYLSSRFYQSFADDLTFNIDMLLHTFRNASRFRFFPISWRHLDQKSNAHVLAQAYSVLRKL
ncbi:MAG: hypothetical protein A2Y14_02820 [Verrucomicrobia bacterium GWF2_51_19]|nr:MAG: hypothetical protein A2Y14_02820 [Verrucomicrobia bacterium GWF2_51_19]HCJ11838.1 glycosyltransferase family 2 protein [Opitutae bacterium]